MTGIPALPDVSAAAGAADTSRLATAKNLKAAGEQFEAVFTGMMLKAMRQTHLADDLFGSKAQDQFREMWDARTVSAMAAHTPLGIGRAMTDFLARGNAALGATPAAPEQGKADVNPDPAGSRA